MSTTWNRRSHYLTYCFVQRDDTTMRETGIVAIRAAKPGGGWHYIVADNRDGSRVVAENLTKREALAIGDALAQEVK
jgi:hypothetical protein